MSFSISTVANSQTFGTWLQRVNQLIGIVNSNTVVLDSSSGGAVSTGNGYVNGNIGVLNLEANTLGGTNGAINFVTNTNFGVGLNPVAVFAANSTNSSVNISSNVVNFSNSTILYGNTFVFGNSSSSLVINSTFYSGTANNANSVGGIPSVSLVTSAMLQGNLASIGTGAVPGGANAQLQYNNSGTFAAASSLYYNNVSNTLTIGNTTVLATINSTSYSGTANQATYLGGLTSTSFQLVSGLAANVATMTANNSNYFGSQLPSYYANATIYTGKFNGTTINASGNSMFMGIINATASLQVSGLDDGGAGGQLRIVGGNYGSFFRNDGVSFFHMITASANQYGTYNSLRPYSVNLTTGYINIDSTGAGVTFGGNVTVNNSLVFSDGSSQSTAATGGLVAAASYEVQYGPTYLSSVFNNNLTITRTGVGVWQAAFTNPLANSNYAVMIQGAPFGITYTSSHSGYQVLNFYLLAYNIPAGSKTTSGFTINWVGGTSGTPQVAPTANSVETYIMLDPVLGQNSSGSNTSYYIDFTVFT